MGYVNEDADDVELLNPEMVTGLIVLHSERCARLSRTCGSYV